jgi:hypothetical protein
MDSAINYYNKEEPELRYKPGKLFLDNGAYTAQMTGMQLEVKRLFSSRKNSSLI